jgi:hypothetical protein
MGWLLLVLIALVAVGAGLHGRGEPALPRSGSRPPRRDRLDREAAHYRASGALPPWD